MITSDVPPYLSPEVQSRELAEFLARQIKPYDTITDDYERPPFAADTKEGKNDPIYNAHSYHTKVPPRGIIPYILHYTKPGDLVLDPFCGSGMTGVAAQLCGDPPKDLMIQFPELQERVGPRACLLNDLSPAACHIAYNYNTPVNVDALRHEYERIKAEVKDEFDWLYGTEHYEPAIGAYSSRKPEVVARLKNPPTGATSGSLIENADQTWELLTRAEVESRLGYSVNELPHDEAWGETNLAEVDQWICIPSTIQYTIWSDVYRCEGLITFEEPTGKVSSRGKNAGQPMTRKKRVARGCGADFDLWTAAVNEENGTVDETFACPHCGQSWSKIALKRQTIVPIRCVYECGRIADSPRISRRVTRAELKRISEISATPIPYWYPQNELDRNWPQYRRDAISAKKIFRVDQFYTHRNLWAIARLRHEIQKAPEESRPALFFALTGVATTASRMNTHHFGGQARPRVGTLYVPSFAEEANVLRLLLGKEKSHPRLFQILSKCVSRSRRVVTTSSATSLAIPSESVDYIFTDPPFGSNIYYSDLNIVWESWLRAVTNRDNEAVIHRKNDGGDKRIADYERLMSAAIAEMSRVLKPGHYATIVFNNSDGAVFEVIKRAVSQAGFTIENMLILDKVQKSFKQIVGDRGEQDVVGMDVLFNLLKPAVAAVGARHGDHDLEHQVTDAVREHLVSLPGRIEAEPAKYSDEHRTTATINSMLMNSLIPRGVSVQQLNLPFIERVCSRYFRKIGQHWYLRGEAVRGSGNSGLFEEEVTIRDDLSAIDWVRQRIHERPLLTGEIKPLWMRATGLLPADVSRTLVLDDILSENFWRDQDTNRWREPTALERERMNDDRSTRVLHDAERYFAGTLRRETTDAERCEWIDILFKACRQVEEGDVQSTPTLRDFDIGEGYRLITRLFQSVLRDHVAPDEFSKASKQASVASNRVAEGVRQDEAELAALRKKKERTLFD